MKIKLWLIKWLEGNKDPDLIPELKRPKPSPNPPTKMHRDGFRSNQQQMLEELKHISNLLEYMANK